MAVGDIKWFAQALLDIGKKEHDLSADTIKVGIVDSTTTPLLSTANPCWGSGGSTNFASNQVPTGGTSYTGPQTLANKSWALQSNVATFRGDDITLNQDASGFTNGRWGIVYNDSHANKKALGFIDLGSARSLVTGQLVLNFGGAGTDVLTLTQS